MKKKNTCTVLKIINGSHKPRTLDTIDDVMLTLDTIDDVMLAYSCIKFIDAVIYLVYGYMQRNK
jgi:hypothetical protein